MEGSRMEEETLTQDFLNVEIHIFNGLLVNFAKKLGSNCILRSMRSFGDFEHEKTLARRPKQNQP